MPRYLARVELYNATNGDYTRLNDDMVAVTFETSMMGDNGRRYSLPSAEFFLDTDRDLQAVRGLVEHTIERLGKDHVLSSSRSRRLRGRCMSDRSLQLLATPPLPIFVSILALASSPRTATSQA